MSNVLVLPGTEWQIPLVKKITEMGNALYVVSPEYDPPCRKYATDYFQSDIFDLDKIESFSREKEIDAVISDECDIAMPVVAELGKRLNLSTLSVKDANLYTDKYEMREFCRKKGLNYPEYRLCYDIEDAISFYNSINNPLIIKPVDSNASHGVFTINNVDEIKMHFDEALSFSRVEKAVLAERFIDGPEFTIDGIKTLSGHYTLAISEKKHYKHNHNIANELYFTHKSKNFDYEKLKEENDEFVMSSGLKFGFTHAEYKYENGKYYLIEIAARGGGNMISGCITQFMSGFDTYKYLVKSSITNPYFEDFSIPEGYKSRASVLKFFETPGNGGIVKNILGIDLISKEKDIKFWELNFRIGDRIVPAINDSVRVGCYIACCESEKKLNELMQKIEKEFVIEIE